MRVVFNNLATLKAKTGVGHYAARLAEQLAPLVDLTVFPSLRVAPAAGGAARSGAGRPWLKHMARAAAGAWFRFAYTPRRFDLYHEPNFLPLPSRLPTVITVHDLSVINHPEWHPADRVRRHDRDFRWAVERAARVITVSQAVRREVIDTLGVAPDRVTAVPNGVGPEFLAARPDPAVQARLGLPDRYLLYVGTIEPRKNLMTLLRAWCDLDESTRLSCPLVLAGGWGWKADDVAEFLDNTGKARGVMHLGYVADADRPALFAGARSLVFPSHYEGFGLPPLEMLAAGGAVIASDVAAHREVLGRHAAMIDPGDYDGWRDALKRASTDDDWLNELRQGGRRHAAQFTWERTARETVAAYAGATPLRQAA
jgi:alpha-1,3-rhamnosyl/mannosyltransferase